MQDKVHSQLIWQRIQLLCVIYMRTVLSSTCALFATLLLPILRLFIVCSSLLKFLAKLIRKSGSFVKICRNFRHLLQFDKNSRKIHAHKLCDNNCWKCAQSFVSPARLIRIQSIDRIRLNGYYDKSDGAAANERSCENTLDFCSDAAISSASHTQLTKQQMKELLACDATVFGML